MSRDAVFVDAGAWIDFANEDADHHRLFVETIKKHAGRLLTSSFVIDEAVTRCRYDLGHRVAVDLGDMLLSGTVAKVVHVSAKQIRAALGLLRDRPDKIYSVTDCTSFVLMRERSIKIAIATDDDFRREQFTVIPALPRAR